jgi:hypothetical protein
MEFGDLRSLVAQVREDHERIDELVYLLLEHQGGERFDEHVVYVVDSLHDIEHGRVCLADVVEWSLDGVGPLYQRLGEEFHVAEGIVEEFLAGWAWAVVRRSDKAPYGVIESARGNTSLYMYGSPTDAWEMHVSSWVDRETSGPQRCWDITVDDTDWGGPPGLGRAHCRGADEEE